MSNISGQNVVVGYKVVFISPRGTLSASSTRREVDLSTSGEKYFKNIENHSFFDGFSTGVPTQEVGYTP